MKDALFASLLPRQVSNDPSLRHHEDPVGQGQHFRQVGGASCRERV